MQLNINFKKSEEIHKNWLRIRKICQYFHQKWQDSGERTHWKQTGELNRRIWTRKPYNHLWVGEDKYKKQRLMSESIRRLLDSVWTYSEAQKIKCGQLGHLVIQVLTHTLGVTGWSRKVQKPEPKNANHSWTASPTRGYSLFICSKRRGKSSNNTNRMGLSGRNYETRGLYEW